MVKNSECHLDYFFTEPPCAVYLLLRKGKVVYAGQSKNIFSRIANHWQNMQKRRKGKKTYTNSGVTEIIVPIFDQARIFPCAKKDLDKEELLLIQKYKPEYNIRMVREEVKPVLPKLLEQPFMKELITTTHARVIAQKPKYRKVPISNNWKAVNQGFRRYRDARTGITLPKLKCLEDEHAT